MSAPEEEEPLRVYALRFTSRARSDIDAAYDRFLELSGEDIADEWKVGLFEAVAKLATMPHRRIALENSRFQQTVRQVVYRRRSGSIPYRILFTVVETEDDAPYVRILHVRHGSAHPISRAEAHDIEAEQ